MSHSEKEPIVIRAHHLSLFEKALLRNPSKVAVEYATVIQNDFSDWDRRKQDYAKDAMGIPENYDNFRDRIENVLRELKDAPYDYPVNLVSGQPDGICSSCAVGQHCSMKMHDCVNSINFDNCYLKSFLLAARKIGVEPEMTTSQRSFRDSSKLENVRTVKTDKQTLARVLRNGMDIYIEWLRDPLKEF